jgi:KaiC/GvpD/RAD55 family RecA-like ATPase
MDSDPKASLFPPDARLIELPANSKVAREDYRGTGVPPSEFLGLSGNVGMILDGQYVLVDIDAPNAEEARFLAARLDREAPTRLVKTPRGGSHRIYLVPRGFRGTNAKMRRADGSPYADLKTLGYAVGPGSSIGGVPYVLERDIAPVDAPAWLLDSVVAKTDSTPAEGPQRENSGFAYGEHADALFKTAAFLRGQFAFGPLAIVAALEGLQAQGLLVGERETDPFTKAHFSKIAQSVCRYPAQKDPTLGVTYELELRSAAETPLSWDPTRWVLHGFVPEAELVMIYGKSGVGKTSFATWLVNRAVARGMRTAVALREERFERFAARCHYGGLKSRDDLFDLSPLARTLKFPSGVDTLRRVIQEFGLQFVYLDSIYDHFDAVEGNAAEKARNGLTPLAELAQELGCLIVATYHENKQGEALGSVEMQNVPRVTLKLTRGKAGPMKARVAWSNFPKPDYLLQFEVERVAHVGQLEENEAGELVQAYIEVPKFVGKTETDDAIEEVTDADGQVLLDNIEAPTERKPKTRKKLY